MKIIRDSQNWIKKVPDEYAIRCIHQIHDPKTHKISLLFAFVVNAGNSPGTGFVQRYGILFNIPKNIDGVLISINDLSFHPEVYIKTKASLLYRGHLVAYDLSSKLETCLEPIFTNTYHVSLKHRERQKSDIDAPEWLKFYAKNHNATVAYFEI